MKRHTISHNDIGNESYHQVEEDSDKEFDIPWALAVEKRIAKNLENVDFEDDSDDDTEWAPTPEDVLLVENYLAQNAILKQNTNSVSLDTENVMTEEL